MFFVFSMLCPAEFGGVFLELISRGLIGLYVCLSELAACLLTCLLVHMHGVFVIVWTNYWVVWLCAHILCCLAGFGTVVFTFGCIYKYRYTVAHTL